MGFFEEYFGWIIGLTIAGLIVFVIFAVISIGAKQNRLIAQCMADGKKEYECEAMFKQDTVAIPVVIPVGR